MIRRLAASLLLLAGVTAQADPSSRARACTQITDSTARLACFDAAFPPAIARPPAAAPAPGAESPVGSAAQAVAAAPRAPTDPVASFGDKGQLPAAKAQRAELPKRLNFHVKQAEALRGGLYRLTMDNGQVWVTKESDWALEFGNGDEVTIQRMALGGYRISHVGQGRNVAIGRIM
jgi:hypothetical protein